MHKLYPLPLKALAGSSKRTPCRDAPPRRSTRSRNRWPEQSTQLKSREEVLWDKLANGKLNIPLPLNLHNAKFCISISSPKNCVWSRQVAAQVFFAPFPLLCPARQGRQAIRASSIWPSYNNMWKSFFRQAISLLLLGFT